MIKISSTFVFLLGCASFCFALDFIKEIPPPGGYHLLSYPENSFSHYLQTLPLKKDNKIYKWNGKKVLGVLYNVLAVVDSPLLFESDLEQCADYCMRFWADFHKSQNNLKNLFLYSYGGEKIYYKNSNQPYIKFLKWHMAYSNSYSIKMGASSINEEKLKPGDMFVQNKDGGIGHVSMIVNAAENTNGKRVYLIGYGFIPAQEFHIERAKAGYGEDGWFTKTGYEKYLSEFPFYSYGRPVLRRFE